MPEGKQLTLLDRPTITTSSGARHTFDGKQAAVLALAALEPDISRRRVALMLWPDSPEPQARNNLRTLVHRLNRQLGFELLGGSERLAVDAATLHLHRLSVDEIVSSLRVGGARSAELLSGFALESLDEFQAWLSGVRRRELQRQLAELEQALSLALENSDHSRAIELARASVALDPLSEHWHRQLMRTLLASGDRAAALVAYEECKDSLRRNLGAAPDDRSRSLHVRILQSQALGASDPRTRAVSDRSSMLLIERDLPLTRLQAALDQGAHLVLQGEAGVGKTRLLRHFIEGKRVERVQIRAGAHDEPYAALGQLLQEVQQRRALRLARSERLELARVAPDAFPDDEPSTAGPSMARLHAALRHWATALAEADIRLLALDDLHYADAASQAALAGLLDATHGGRQPLQLLLCHRTGETEATMTAAIEAAEVRQHLVSITLQRLSLQGIEALLTAMDGRLERAKASQLATALIRTTGGNPLFVIELALPALEHVDARFGMVGTNLDALLQSRLSGCSPGARQLASVAGVALSEFSVELAAAVTGHSPLALMPAWTELQQRGLFSDHGLAHDLVRDAVLAALPHAIEKALHRRIALFLEASQIAGIRVLRHWRAAHEFDRALPHALLQWRQHCRTGHATERAQTGFLETIEGLSGEALMENFVLTLEISLDDLPAEFLSRFLAITDRAEQLSENDEQRALIAVNRALAFCSQCKWPAARVLLEPALAMLPSKGPARSWCEMLLAAVATVTSGDAIKHLTRAEEAVADLEQPHHRLRWNIESLKAMVFGDIVSRVRRQVLEVRRARARGDLAAVAELRDTLAYTYFQNGLMGAASRQFRANGIHAVPDEDRRKVWGVIIGLAAAGAGRYAEALAAFEHCAGALSVTTAPPLLAYTWLRLGRPDRARPFADAVLPGSLDGAPGTHVVHVLALSELATLDGLDPIAPIAAERDRLREAGASASQLVRFDWEIVSLTATAETRIELLGRMIPGLRANRWDLPRLPRALLELAEAHAELGDSDFRAPALEAAGHLRRGRNTLTLYLPDGLVRLAVLLDRSDPAVASALRHVARRWLLSALPHVPADARDSFMKRHPVNPLLLAS